MKKHSPSRLFALALLPWLIVLAVPEIRAQFQLQFDGLFTFNLQSYVNNPFSEEDLPWIRLRSKPIAKAAAEHPRDVALAFVAAETAANADADEIARSAHPADRGLLRAHAFDSLYSRFPDQSWILASRLRTTLTQFRDDRSEDYVQEGSKPAVPSGPPPIAPPYPKTKKALDPAELQGCMEAARRGRQAEPQNSFYDWWLAYFLYAGNRDSEALAVLHQGAQKHSYNDHMRDELQARVRAHALTHITTAESKANVMAWQLLPHYSAMRHFGRLIARRCNEDKSHGRHQQALQATVDITRLAALMREQAYMELDSQVGIGITSEAWRAITRVFTDGEKQKLSTALDRANEQAQLQGHLAAAYAELHGDKPTAALMRREIMRIAAEKRATNMFLRRTDNFLGLRQELEMPALTLWLASNILLWQTVTLCGLSLLLPALAWPLGMEKIPSLRVGSSRCAMSCYLLYGCLVVAMYFGGAGWKDYFGPDRGLTSDGTELAAAAIIAGLVLPLGLPLLVACVVTWRRRPRTGCAPGHPRSAGPAPCRATAAWNRLKRLPGQLKAARDRQLNPQTTPSNPAILSGTTFARVTITATLLLFGLATTATVFLLILANYMPLSFNGSNISTDDLGGYLIVEISLWVLVWLVRGRPWRVFKTNVAAVLVGLRWYRSSLFTYLLFTGWIYLALSLMNLGFRREANAAMDAFLQRGEKATLLTSPDGEQWWQSHPLPEGWKEPSGLI